MRRDVWEDVGAVMSAVVFGLVVVGAVFAVGYCIKLVILWGIS